MRVVIFAVMLETVPFYMSEKSPLIDYHSDPPTFSNTNFAKAKPQGWRGPSHMKC